MRDKIREHTRAVRAPRISDSSVEASEIWLLECFMSELAKVEEQAESKALHDLRHEVAELHKERLSVMKTAAELKVTSDALKASVDGAIALITTPGQSTPDNIVSAFQSDVQAQTDRLNAAEAPPAPTPAPAPAPATP